MPKRIESRWTTPFASWLAGYSVRRLAHELAAAGEPITPRGVYDWVYGNTAPTARRAMAITRISGGAVTLEQVYQHREVVQGMGERRV